jgi:5-methyltetrahydrofolate--homocysteine methyltransferase
MIGRTVRMPIAEAASAWLDASLRQSPASLGSAATTPSGREGDIISAINPSGSTTANYKVIKPAAGYASCPDHTLKGDILKLLCKDVHMHGDTAIAHSHAHDCTCGHCHEHDTSLARALGISLTESYAMTPESSICGLIFMHPQACYPEVRRISQEQYDEYIARRGMDEQKALRFLGHLLK